MDDLSHYCRDLIGPTTKKNNFFMCVFPNDNSEITFTTQFYHKLWKKRCVNVIMTLAGVFYIYYLNTEQIGW